MEDQNKIISVAIDINLSISLTQSQALSLFRKEFGEDKIPEESLLLTNQMNLLSRNVDLAWSTLMAAIHQAGVGDVENINISFDSFTKPDDKGMPSSESEAIFKGTLTIPEEQYEKWLNSDVEYDSRVITVDLRRV